MREIHVERGGVPFGLLSARPVILHDRRFSPNNGNVQLDASAGTDTPVFFSFGLDRVLRKAVVVLHVMPIGDGPSDRVRGWMKGRHSLGQLVEGLREHIPVAHGHFARMIGPLLSAEEAASPAASVLEPAGAASSAAAGAGSGAADGAAAAVGGAGAARADGAAAAAAAGPASASSAGDRTDEP